MTRYNMTKEPSMNEVYSRVNRLAHQLAVFEEMRLRGAILSQVLEARDKGASAIEMNQLMDKIEAAGKLVL
jgi:hypothetical protein